MSSISTPNLPAAAVLTEIVGNGAEGTARQTFADHAAQLSGSGAISTRLSALEASATTGARYMEDTLADLQAVVGAANGDVGFILDDGANTGTWRRVSGTWTRVADLPPSLTTLIDLPAFLTLLGQADSDDLPEGSANLYLTSAERTRVGDAWADQGDWDASSGAFPSGSSANDVWRVSVAGTVDSVPFLFGDHLRALVDNASTGTFNGNWARIPGGAALAERALATTVATKADASALADYRTKASEWVVTYGSGTIATTYATRTIAFPGGRAQQRGGGTSYNLSSGNLVLPTAAESTRYNVFVNPTTGVYSAELTTVAMALSATKAFVGTAFYSTTQSQIHFAPEQPTPVSREGRLIESQLSDQVTQAYAGFSSLDDRIDRQVYAIRAGTFTTTGKQVAWTDAEAIYLSGRNADPLEDGSHTFTGTGTRALVYNTANDTVTEYAVNAIPSGSGLIVLVIVEATASALTDVILPGSRDYRALDRIVALETALAAVADELADARLGQDTLAEALATINQSLAALETRMDNLET